MTLIAAYSSATEQIVVADRRLVDGRTGRMITDEAHKVLQFCNQERGYEFAVGFTGVATVGKFRTIDWLTSVLPKCFSGTGDINDYVARFQVECSRAFAALPIKRSRRETTFVFAGHLEHAGPISNSGVIVVSNRLTSDGSELSDISDRFGARITVADPAVDPRSFHAMRILGDPRARARIPRAKLRVWKYLHRPISAATKLEILARLVRTAGCLGSSVGKDVIGLCIRPGDLALAGEWPATKGRRETMPPLVFASGVVFSGASLPPSLGEPLGEFES